MALGGLILDLDGDLEMTPDDRERLLHPGCGGVILFSRNYQDRQQLQELVASIHRLREAPLLVCVDQEGGPVQRFRKEFTALPAAAVLGALYDRDRAQGLVAARRCGWVMACELRQTGVDFSFAPVLDVARAGSEVIGERAFHAAHGAVAQLAGAFVDGMSHAGMAAVGKHFPGHGGVSGDSHHCLPCDPRDLEALQTRDLLPYLELQQELTGIMTAHVLYEQITPDVPCYSRYWLQDVLRRKIGFGGVVFSDDLSMRGAVTDREIEHRADDAFDAGCDFVLVCNDRAAAGRVLERSTQVAAQDEQRLARRELLVPTIGSALEPVGDKEITAQVAALTAA